MSGVITIGSGNERALQSAVANVGPVSTYVDASHSSFQVGTAWVSNNTRTNSYRLTQLLVSFTVMVFWTSLTALVAS